MAQQRKFYKLPSACTFIGNHKNKRRVKNHTHQNFQNSDQSYLLTCICWIAKVITAVTRPFNFLFVICTAINDFAFEQYRQFICFFIYYYYFSFIRPIITILLIAQEFRTTKNTSHSEQLIQFATFLFASLFLLICDYISDKVRRLKSNCIHYILFVCGFILHVVEFFHPQAKILNALQHDNDTLSQGTKTSHVPTLSSHCCQIISKSQ